MSITHIPIEGIDIYLGSYDDIDAAFSATQIADINTLAIAKRRRERALTYILLNHAALTDGRYLPCAGAPVGHDNDGAPFLMTPHRVAAPRISLSHCRTGACIALGPIDLKFGIDIEDHSDKLERVKSKFINSDDLRSLDTLASTTASALLVAWTIKEAVYKAAGINGLSLRDGITIKNATEATAAGITYRCHSILSPTRCLTGALRNPNNIK